MAELYSTAIGMCSWAEARGASTVVLSEHHGSSDGYLPTPLLLAGAIAARTERISVRVAAVLLPFYDAVRLTEEMNVLDLISEGRVSYVLAIGYRPEEFEHFGVDPRRRGQIAEDKLRLLLRLRGGEPVVHEGRRIHVTPPPHTPGGPYIALGGGSRAAARRAGRFGLDLQANGAVPGMREAYQAACAEHGREPGVVSIPDLRDPSVVFVAEDVDAAWNELGHHLFHDACMYSSWNPGDDQTAMISHATTVDELRQTSTGYRIMSVPEATEYVEAGGVLKLAPLCGGVPPEVAWPYLERAAAVAASVERSPSGSVNSRVKEGESS